jgi:hypothetical protein
VVLPFIDLSRSLVYRHTRKKEKLPAIAIQYGKTVYCRMQLCDFWFPLPRQAQVVRSEVVRGGDDAVTGVIYVTNEDGRPVDLAAYQQLLMRHGFQNFPMGCPYSDVVDAVEQSGNTTNRADCHVIAWIVQNKDSGTIAIDVVSNYVKIGFDYWGDY